MSGFWIRQIRILIRQVIIMYTDRGVGPLFSSQERRATVVTRISRLSAARQLPVNQSSCSSIRFTSGLIRVRASAATSKAVFSVFGCQIFFLRPNRSAPPCPIPAPPRPNPPDPALCPNPPRQATPGHARPHPDTSHRSTPRPAPSVVYPGFGFDRFCFEFVVYPGFGFARRRTAAGRAVRSGAGRDGTAAGRCAQEKTSEKIILDIFFCRTRN